MLPKLNKATITETKQSYINSQTCYCTVSSYVPFAPDMGTTDVRGAVISGIDGVLPETNNH